MNTSTLNNLAGLIAGMALKDRIQELVDAGYKNADLARAAGKSRAAVTHWLNGETLEIKADTAAGLQTLTGYNSIWISTGKGPKKVTTNTAPGPTIHGVVPLLSNVQAGMYTEFVDNLHPGEGEYEKIPTIAPINRHTFALRVMGDSMLPEFPEGLILIIEPELSPEENDYVVARNGCNETTFKQLIKDGGQWYLKALNPRYPINPLGECTIIGVLRAVGRRYR